MIHILVTLLILVVILVGPYLVGRYFCDEKDYFFATIEGLFILFVFGFILVFCDFMYGLVSEYITPQILK